MRGTVANTDRGWFEYLCGRPDLSEVNFWSPSPRRSFRGDLMTPFFFRLKAPVKAVAGFAFFARWERLPVWLAWEAFGAGNGADSFPDLVARLEKLRAHIRYEPPPGPDEIGCSILLDPVFFPRDLWVPEPGDWKERTQGYRYYDLDVDEGAILWRRCQEAARAVAGRSYDHPSSVVERAARYGAPQLVLPRLGQGGFRIATLQAYQRACAVTGEHSLPALEAAHIWPFQAGGPHEVSNGILLRADLHRLFDRGYVTITPDLAFQVSPKLRRDFHNGRTYYPLDGQPVKVPRRADERPDPERLEWHVQNVFLG